MERSLAPQRPWMTVVGYFLGVVALGSLAKLALVGVTHPPESELRVRCHVAGNTELAGLRFTVVWSRSDPDRPGVGWSGLVEFDPPRRDPEDPDLYVASVAPPRIRGLPDDRPSLARRSDFETLKLLAESTSHGSVWKKIDSLETEVGFDPPATVSVRIEPPLDPNDLDRWFVLFEPRTEGKEFFGRLLEVGSSYRDGAFHGDAIQPGRYEIRLDRHSLPDRDGFSFAGNNGESGAEPSRFEPIVDLLPGANEVVLPRRS